jgi:tripartite-type tricarboxylate transporter receptor subunit TctC
MSTLSNPWSRRRFAAAALALAGTAAHGQPLAPAAAAPRIRLVIPFSAGATSDVLARPIMEALAGELGQPIVIDNRPGAGGMRGAAEVARAAPDGLTLAWGTVSNHAISPNLFPNPPYDPLRDFTPISLICSVPHVIMVHPRVPAGTLAELVALLRREPGRWEYASSGNGTSSHLIAEAFKAATRTFVVHIPYKPSQGLPDFLAGRVPLKFDTVVMSRAPVLDGRARALAVTSTQRSAVLPQVPTVQESGVPELAQFEATGWFGLYGPTGLPAEIVARLNAAVLAVLRRPEIVAHLRNHGADLIGSTPQAFAEHNRREFERWGALIRRLGVRVD